jgi:UPF0271 protein
LRNSASDKDMVVDSTAFYAGLPFSSGLRCFTTPLVYEEIKHIKKSYHVLEALIDSGKLNIMLPMSASIRIIIQVAKQTGDLYKLSKADLSILALAYDLKRVLISDDYKIANVAARLDIEINTLSAKGISSIRRWVAYCSACGTAHHTGNFECKCCGNKLQYRYKKAQKFANI